MRRCNIHSDLKLEAMYQCAEQGLRSVHWFLQKNPLCYQALIWAHKIRLNHSKWLELSCMCQSADISGCRAAEDLRVPSILSLYHFSSQSSPPYSKLSQALIWAHRGELGWALPCSIPASVCFLYCSWYPKTCHLLPCQCAL